MATALQGIRPVDECERLIRENVQIVAQDKKDVRCKVIQAVALAAFFVIAGVAAIILTTLYAPTYAPLIAVAVVYLSAGPLKDFLITHFKNKWVAIEKEIQKIQAIGEKHREITKDHSATKATYLDAHFKYWTEVSDKALEAHRNKLKEAQTQTQKSQTAVKEKEKVASAKKARKCYVHAQQNREDALQARVEAAFIRALMNRPNYTYSCPKDALPKDALSGVKNSLFTTHYAPIPLHEAEGDLTIQVSFDSPWARHLLVRDLPPYNDIFFESERRIGGLAFTRLEIMFYNSRIQPAENPIRGLDLARPPVQPIFDMLVSEIVSTMDEQTASVGQALDQSGSGDGAQQLKGLAQNT